MKSPLITNEAEWKEWTAHTQALPIVGNVGIVPISYPCICVMVSNTLGTTVELIYTTDFDRTSELVKAKEAMKLYKEEKNGTPSASGAGGSL